MVFKRKRKQKQNKKKGSNLSKRVTDIERQIKKPMNYQNFIYSQQIGNTTAGFVLLSDIEPGDDRHSRMSNVIEVHNLSLKYTLKSHGTGSPWVASTDAFSFRLLLFIDKRTKGAQCNKADVMQTPLDVRSGYKLAQNRFKVLYDKYVDVYMYKPIVTLKEFIRLKTPLRIEYDSDTASTIVNHPKNSLQLMIYSNQDANKPEVFTYTRVGFKDIVT